MTSNYIVKPIITEKSFELSKQGQFTFLVNPKSNKHSIAEAVETLFKVDVLKVRLLNNHSKVKRSGNTRHQILTSARKKAIITLKSGQTIEYFQLPEEKSAPVKKEVKKTSKLKNILKKAKSKSTTTKSRSSIRKGLASTSK